MAEESPNAKAGKFWAEIFIAMFLVPIIIIFLIITNKKFQMHSEKFKKERENAVPEYRDKLEPMPWEKPEFHK